VAYELAVTNNVISTVVSDRDTVNALINFMNNHHFLVEPSCGATLSVLYNEDKSVIQEYMQPDKIVVVIVCGGSGINLDLLLKWKETFQL